ncbi:MAG: hypothetical protein K8I02_04315, partial [Candidatus Methylomirabilis sp.]|nr:hypothetical protein [Deltaproteobacteria bacterium]
DADSLPRLHALLSRIASARPVYAVKGNWDSWYWQGLDLFGGTGVRPLDGEAVEFRVGPTPVRLGGVAVRNENATPAMLAGYGPEALNLYLYHSPDLVEELDGRGVDFYFAGHTHGGQIRLPPYGALITFSKFDKKYEMGLYRLDGLTLYVNRGIGTEGHVPPIRFMSVPEVTVHRILPASP